MLNFFNLLFTTNGFEPHGHCFLWTPPLLLLYVLSDGLIAFSYYSIPIALIYFVRKRKDLVFNWVFVMFGAFILACGVIDRLVERHFSPDPAFSISCNRDTSTKSPGLACLALGSFSPMKSRVAWIPCNVG